MIALLLTLLLSTVSVTSEASWVEKDLHRYYSDCFTEEQFNGKLAGVNVSIIDLVCDFVRHSNYAYTVVIHSGLRTKQIGLQTHNGKWHGSRHLLGVALDFHLEEAGYHLMDKQDKEISYYRKTLELEHFLANGSIDDLVGFGLYCVQNNPFFHLDTRGFRARWARMTPTGYKYVAYKACIDYLKEQLDAY